MEKTTKVLALAVFTYAGTLYHPGEVEVPEGAVEGLEKKQLVKRLDGDGSAPPNASSSGDAVYDELKKERDQLSARVAELEAELGGENVLDWDKELRKEFSDAEAETVLLSEYSMPHAIKEADPKLLNKLHGFGDAKVAKLKELAARFVG